MAVTLYWIQLLYVPQLHKAGPTSRAVPVATAATIAPTLKLPVVEKSPGVVVATVPVASPNVSAPAPILRRLLPVTEQFKLAQAAQIAFNNILDQADRYPDTYGFFPGDVLANARLGGAIPIYTIAERDRTGYKSGQPVKPLLQPAERWVFPVFIGQQIRCMIQVARDGHNYVPGGGSKILAVCWNKILQKWPLGKGYHPQLIINPDIPGYYFTVPELQIQNVTDVNQMIFSNGDLSPAAVILASWG